MPAMTRDQAAYMRPCGPWTGGFGAKFTPDGTALIYKDPDGALWRLALDRSVRSPIELPHIEADWDIHFGG